MNRRDFLKVVSAAGVATTAAACGVEQNVKLVPYVVPPEGITPGVPVYYASTCRECPVGCGVHVKTREGRPIKVFPGYFESMPGEIHDIIDRMTAKSEADGGEQ